MSAKKKTRAQTFRRWRYVRLHSAFRGETKKVYDANKQYENKPHGCSWESVTRSRWLFAKYTERTSEPTNRSGCGTWVAKMTVFLLTVASEWEFLSVGISIFSKLMTAIRPPSSSSSLSKCLLRSVWETNDDLRTCRSTKKHRDRVSHLYKCRNLRYQTNRKTTCTVSSSVGKRQWINFYCFCVPAWKNMS